MPSTVWVRRAESHSITLPRWTISVSDEIETAANNGAAVDDVAVIDHDQVRCSPSHVLPVDCTVLRPLREHDEGRSLFDTSFGKGRCEVESVVESAGRHHRVMGPDMRTSGPQRLDDLKRRQFTHVVGSGLERQAEYGNRVSIRKITSRLTTASVTTFAMCWICDSLASMAAHTVRIGAPAEAARLASARVSFGRQDPPHPRPGLR